MKNIYPLLWGLVFCLPLIAQNDCSGTLNCDDAKILCDLSYFDTKQCENSNIPNTPFPFPNLCLGVGIPHNLSWWSFVGTGNALTITFEINPSDCRQGRGIQAGVLEGGCNGFFYWDCNASCNSSTFSLSGGTDIHEIYYLFVDGCNGDVCSFEISLNGIKTPTPIPEIDSLELPDVLCTGGPIDPCVPSNTGNALYRTWSIGGIETTTREDCINTQLDPRLGPISEVEVCLTLTLGEPSHPDEICDQKTRCQIVPVDSITAQTGPLLEVCYSDQPFYWNGMLIDSSCINPPCTVLSSIPDGCDVDSIRPIRLLPPSDSIYVDTFICDGSSFSYLNSPEIPGIVCDSLIYVDNGGDCPSSLFLTVRRPVFDIDWGVDIRLNEICVDVLPDLACGEKDSSDFCFVLFYKNEPIDTFDQYGCTEFLGEGLYSLDILSKTTTCPYQIRVDTGILLRPLFVNIIGKDTLCRGDSLTLTVETNFDEYFWENGPTNEPLMVRSGGTYCVTGRRLTGGAGIRKCITIHEAFIDVQPSIVPDNGTDNGAIYLTTLGSPPPFNYQWSSGETTDFISGKKAGDYAVRVTNGFGCDTLLLLKIPMATSTKEHDHEQLIIYPNPTANEVWINDKGIDAIMIYDMQGREIRREIRPSNKITLKDLRDGIYILQATFKKGKTRTAYLMKRSSL